MIGTLEVKIIINKNYSFLKLIKPIDKIIVNKIDIPGICIEKSTKL